MEKIMFAFVFPGQGSQHIGMVADLAANHPSVKDLFTQASETLGYDLWQLTQVGPEEALNKTEQTQPALLVAGVAAWQVWQKMNGPMPTYLAGHSLGEYTALVCSGSLNFQDAVTLVADRGRYMQDAVTSGKGGMAAILGLPESTVEEICKEVSAGDEVVSPANYNSVGQIVIAGESQALDRAVTLAKEKGAKLAKKLLISVPSHCDLMKPAAIKLAERLQSVTFRMPTIPVINNVDVKSYTQSADIADALVRQLYSPVRWLETIRFFADNGVQLIIESGPNKVLTGLNKRIDEQMIALAITESNNIQEAIQQCENLSLVGE
jgi:[acyl-carrier-protein] S-malonyltransferase